LHLRYDAAAELEQRLGRDDNSRAPMQPTTLVARDVRVITADRSMATSCTDAGDTMKKGLLVLVGLLASAGASFAQSSKAAVEVGTFNVMDTCSVQTGCVQTSPWATLLRATIQTPSQKDLIVGASLQTALFTSTQVKSKGTQDTSQAEAKIEVRVVIDPATPNVGAAGRNADPGVVVYDRRRQNLAATFGGVFTCTGITLDTCNITDEVLQLILDTTSAHHFNFIIDDTGTGTHIVELQVRLNTNTAWQAGGAEATAVIGKGSLTVEEVRLVKGSDVVVP
jgi:hypothetical protein